MTNSKQTLNTKYQISKPEKKFIEIDKPGKYIIELLVEKSEVEIVGAWHIQEKEILDLEVVIHHKAPNTLANTTLKAVASGSAKVKLAGKIIVDKDCNGVNSFLTERALLLSESASAEAIPDLEIESNDVKCSHAASVSSINQDQLFYLMSRGIDRKKAEDLVVEGFLKH